MSGLLESIGPVVAAPVEDLDRLVVQMDLHAVAVELDFVIHRDPDGTLSIEDARAGSTKSGNGALMPISAGFLRVNATNELHATKRIQGGTCGIVPEPVNPCGVASASFNEGVK
jgi:hypothetical protein